MITGTGATMYPTKEKFQRKHFNKVRRPAADFLPAQQFTIVGIYESYIIYAGDQPIVPRHIVLNCYQQQRRTYNEFKSLITKIHNELCGCKKFAICQKSHPKFTTVRNTQIYDDHDNIVSTDYCLQCDNLDLLEFHMNMDPAFNDLITIKQEEQKWDTETLV